MSPRDAVVIGVGNTYRRDDGAGPAVVRALAATPSALPGHARLAVCDGEPTRLIDLWRGADLAIVVDAVSADPDAGMLPGNVMRWEWDERVGGLIGDEHGAEEGAQGTVAGAVTTADDDQDDDEPGLAPASHSASRPPLVEPAGTHALGPGAAIDLARALDLLPSRLVVLAVVGDDFGQGPGLSARAAAAVPVAVDRIAAEMR
ncbi:hydrogenase maturation protease [Catenulispora subtropica]|uniref:Hydrogenase maturation protease n=1 Tax=Catenulispora subtropica TaxID=450798 RepID=A0ABN2RLU8_9ACTN